MTKKISNIHDRFFRQAMSDLRVAAAFFKNNLPEDILEEIDLSSIQATNETFVSGKMKLHIVDILYKANINNSEGYVYLLAEHQSKPDLLMPFRILKYTCDIIENHLKKSKSKVLPVVIPIVFYNGQQSYPYSQDIFDLFGGNKGLAEKVLCQPFQLIDVSKIPDKVLREQKWNGIIEFLMKHAGVRKARQDALVILRILLDWLEDYRQEASSYFEQGVLNYFLNSYPIQEQEYCQVIEKHEENFFEDEKPNYARLVMEFGEYRGHAKGLKEGIEQGIEQGVEQGKEQAVYEVAKKLMSEGLSPELIAKATSLSLEKIKTLDEK